MNDGFAQRVNAVSAMISGMTNDVGERLGIACAVFHIYQHELQKNLISTPSKEAANAAPAPTESNGA